MVIVYREKSVSSSSYDNQSPNKINFDWIVTGSNNSPISKSSNEQHSAINCNEFLSVEEEYEDQYTSKSNSNNGLPPLYFEDNRYTEH